MRWRTSRRNLPRRNTSRSTSRRLTATGRKAWIAAQWLFAAALVWYAVQSLSGLWDEVASGLRGLRPDWLLVGAASGLTLVAYALLIEGWRRLIAGAGEAL